MGTTVLYTDDLALGRRTYFSDRFAGRDVTSRFDYSLATSQLNPSRIVYFGANASDIVGFKLLNSRGLITTEVQFTARDYGDTELGKSMNVTYTTKTILPAGVADTTTTQTVSYLEDEVLNGVTDAVKTCKHKVDFANASQVSQLLYNAPQLGTVKYVENPDGAAAFYGGDSHVQKQYSVSPVPAGAKFLPLLMASTALTPAQCLSLVPGSLRSSRRSNNPSRIETRIRNTFVAANDPVTGKAGFLRTTFSSTVGNPITAKTYYGAFADGSLGVTSFEFESNIGTTSTINYAQYLAAEYPNSLPVGVETNAPVAFSSRDSNLVETFSGVNEAKVTFIGTVVASTLAGKFAACYFKRVTPSNVQYSAFAPGKDAVQALTFFNDSTVTSSPLYRELVKME